MPSQSLKDHKGFSNTQKKTIPHNTCSTKRKWSMVQETVTKCVQTLSSLVVYSWHPGFGFHSWFGRENENTKEEVVWILARYSWPLIEKACGHNGIPLDTNFNILNIWKSQNGCHTPLVTTSIAYFQTSMLRWSMARKLNKCFTEGIISSNPHLLGSNVFFSKWWHYFFDVFTFCLK